MERIQLNYQDKLIVDPCYIKQVYARGDTKKDPRYDALKLVKVVHDGDDGTYPVGNSKTWCYLGVDSGRIWVLQAEFDIEVVLDSGASGSMIVRRASESWDEEISKIDG